MQIDAQGHWTSSHLTELRWVGPVRRSLEGGRARVRLVGAEPSAPSKPDGTRQRITGERVHLLFLLSRSIPSSLGSTLTDSVDCGAKRSFLHLAALIVLVVVALVLRQVKDDELSPRP